MMDIIATQSYAKSVGRGSGDASTYRCCTATKAVSLGCTVASGYSGNRLVPRSALSGPPTPPTPTKSIMKFYVIDSGKGALYVNNVIGEGNWEKFQRVYISGIKTTGQGGTQWTRFLRDEAESIDLVASGEIQFETFSWPQERSWTATIDGVDTTVSMQNGDALLNLTDLIPDPTQSYKFDEIRCDAVLKSEYESIFAVAIGHAET